MASTDTGGKWARHVDEASGSAYYYNAHTGESSWEVPAGFTSSRAQDASQDKAPKWREFVDDESGTTYYFDEVSGTSRWDKPEDFEPEHESEDQGEEEQEPEGQEAAEQQEEEATEETETAEQEPQGDKKKAEESRGDKAGSNDKQREECAEVGVAGVKPRQWVKYVDAASNKPYYYNASTGKTQWEEPEDFDESPAVPAGPQVSVEYQAHLNRVHSERLARVTQRVLDPSGNLSKLNAILNGIDSSAPSAAATVDGETAADAARTAKADWQQHIDAQTQRYYYHNVVTGVTQWSKPEAAIVSG
ncbi:Mycolic acid cyclopropane synthetase, partial [Phytophthora pseudosyringae]